MKAKIGAVPIALLTAAVFGAASAHALESRIDSVTVYPSGVEVTRVVPVSLAEGASVVTLEGLPGDIELDGVTAGAEDARVEVRFVQLDVQEQRDAYDTEVRRLEAAKTAVEDAIQEIDDRIAAAQLQLKFLEALAQEHASKERSEAASGRADVASWQQAVDAVGSGAGAVMGEMRASRQLKRERQKDLSVLQRELDSKRRQSADSASLRLSLVSETAIETTLRVSYWQWSAEWEPSYSAYLDSAASQLRLLHQAQVVQTTGEEWRDVQLRFSTFELDESIQAPDQETRFLDLEDPAVAYARRQAPLDPRLFEFGSEVADIQVRDEREAWNRYAVVFRASDRTDVINSTDQEQTVPLGAYRFGVSLVTRVTPRQDPRAFLTARVTNEGETPLFAGPMRVFVDGTFAGVAELPDLLPQSEAALPMGPDRQVEVTVVDQGGEKGRGGLLNARNTRLADFLFDFANRHAHPIDLEVIDFYPVPRDERIKVSIPRSATRADEQDLEDRPGVVVWRKALGPGERWRILHQYEVNYPTGTALVGDHWLR